MTLYLYGFLRPGSEEPPSDLRGVAGTAVRLFDLGPVRAAVSDVPSDAFDPEAIQERVRDLDWLSEQGALHERVVTWFVDRGGILPVRFLTLYSDEEALRAEVNARADRLADRLDALEGLREWDLKISYEAEQLRRKIGEVSEEVAALDRELEASGPGRRYLLERKRDQVARTETSRAALRLALEAYEELTSSAERSRRLSLPSEADRDLPVILNAALLVRRDEEEGAAARADELRERLRSVGLDLEYTGPWAPYRFVGEDGEDESG